MKASLRVALQDALAARSNFRYHDGESDWRELPSQAFGSHARSLVLWPMANDRRSVRRLFEALDAGVVPVILPKATPALKLAALRAEYRAFGFFNGDTIEAPAAPALADERVYLVLLTSGSTGTPKLVAVNEANLSAGIAAIHEAQQLERVANTGVMLPLAYSYALVNQLLWAAMYGREVHALPGLLDPARSLERMRTLQIEMLCMVAHQIQTLGAMGFDLEHAVESLRVLNFAGAPFPMAAYSLLKRLFPLARIFNNYGCTEAVPRLCVCEVKHAQHPVGLVGQPIQTIRLRIAGDEAVGPIEFQGLSGSIGNMRADGSLESHEAWIPSGDLGRFDEEGLHVLGRHDQIVKVGGERFSLMEIERVLLGMGFDQALVWQDPNTQRIEAVATAKAPHSAAQIAAGLRGALPHAMWPQHIYWTEAWPLLANGKTDRVALQQAAAQSKLACLYPVQGD